MPDNEAPKAGTGARLMINSPLHWYSRSRLIRSATEHAPTPHREPADLPISLGASHAFGTPGQAMRVLREDLRPAGRALFGSEYWAETPTSARTLPHVAGCLRGLLRHPAGHR